MEEVVDYLKQAHECEMLARRAKTPDERDMILGMANTWRFLATQRAQRLKTQAAVAALLDQDNPAAKT